MLLHFCKVLERSWTAGHLEWYPDKISEPNCNFSIDHLSWPATAFGAPFRPKGRMQVFCSLLQWPPSGNQKLWPSFLYNGCHKPPLVAPYDLFPYRVERQACWTETVPVAGFSYLKIVRGGAVAACLSNHHASAPLRLMDDDACRPNTESCSGVNILWMNRRSSPPRPVCSVMTC